MKKYKFSVSGELNFYAAFFVILVSIIYFLNIF